MSGKVFVKVPKRGLAKPLIQCRLYGEAMNMGNGLYGPKTMELVSIPFCMNESSQGQSLAKGHYEFPLEIALPANLPPTMVVNYSNRSPQSHGASPLLFVLYYLVVSCGGASEKISITVGSPPIGATTTPFLIQPQLFPLMSSGLLSKKSIGDIIVGFAADAGEFKGNERIAFKFALVNNSTATVKGIRVKIVESSNCSIISHSQTRYENTFQAKELGSVPTGGDLNSAMAILEGGNSRIFVQLPLVMGQTYQNSQMKVAYMIDFTVLLSGSSDNPSFTRELMMRVVQDAAPGNLKLPAKLPKQWNPIVAPVAVFAPTASR